LRGTAARSDERPAMDGRAGHSGARSVTPWMAAAAPSKPVRRAFAHSIEGNRKHPRERGDPSFRCVTLYGISECADRWIPAFAGMTALPARVERALSSASPIRHRFEKDSSNEGASVIARPAPHPNPSPVGRGAQQHRLTREGASHSKRDRASTKPAPATPHPAASTEPRPAMPATPRGIRPAIRPNRPTAASASATGS